MRGWGNDKEDVESVFARGAATGGADGAGPRGDHASQWAAIGSIAAKIGCAAETLRQWVRRAERDRGQRPGTTTEDRERIRALEREVRELRQANEILRKASAYFAMAELDRRPKP